MVVFFSIAWHPMLISLCRLFGLCIICVKAGFVAYLLNSRDGSLTTQTMWELGTWFGFCFASPSLLLTPLRSYCPMFNSLLGIFLWCFLISLLSPLELFATSFEVCASLNVELNFVHSILIPTSFPILCL